MAFVVVKDIKEEPAYADAFLKLMAEVLHVQPTDDHSDEDDHLVKEEEEGCFHDAGIDYGGDFDPDIQDDKELNQDEKRFTLNIWNDGALDIDNHNNHTNIHLSEIVQGVITHPSNGSMDGADIPKAAPENVSNDQLNEEYGNIDVKVDRGYNDDSEDSMKDNKEETWQLGDKEELLSVVHTTSANIPLSVDLRHDSNDVVEYDQPVFTELLNDCDAEVTDLEGVAVYEEEFLVKNQSCKKFKWLKRSTVYNSAMVSVVVKDVKEEPAYADVFLKLKPESLHVEPSKDKHKNIYSKSDMEDDYQDEKGLNGLLCCEICQKHFSLKSSLKRHIKYVHSTKEKMYHCEICGSRYKLLSSLKRHQHTHSKVRVKSFTCYICSKKFYTRSTLNRHITHVHENIRPFKCDTCEKRFTKSAHLREHVLTHTVRDRTFPCERCDKKFVTAVAVKIHQRAHTDDRPFQCDKCDSSFKCTSSLHTHQRSHSSERPFLCEMCPSAFKTRSHLKRHTETTHSDVKEHTCVICSKSFNNVDSLRGHMIIHSINMPYECDSCGKKFKRKTSLRWHKLTHLGEKNYVCDICNVAFTHPANLRVHKMIHEDRYPHTCPFCKKKYRTSSILKKHKMTHTGDKPLHCQVCGKGFIHSVNLKAHLLTHSGEQPHVCNICKRRFSHISNMKRHRQKMHA